MSEASKDTPSTVQTVQPVRTIKVDSTELRTWRYDGETILTAERSDITGGERSLIGTLHRYELADKKVYAREDVCRTAAIAWALLDHLSRCKELEGVIDADVFGEAMHALKVAAEFCPF